MAVYADIKDIAWFLCRNNQKIPMSSGFNQQITVKTLNIGTPRPATVVVLNMKQFNFTMK